MKKLQYTWLLGPLVILVAITLIILVERTGIKDHSMSAHAVFLPVEYKNYKKIGTDLECSLIYDSTLDASVQCKDNIAFTLESMRITYKATDVAKDAFPELSKYKTAVVALQNYDVLGNGIFELCNWVEAGGRAFLAMPPEYSPAFDAIYPKLGIRYAEIKYGEQVGLRFVTDLLPGANGLEFSSEIINENVLQLHITDDSILHMVSLDESHIPILWEHDYGKGRFVVFNNSILKNKDARGIASAAYSLLQDACVYPVINASVFFIDDFPAPLPEGYHKKITEEFGRSISSFFKSVWLPDILDLSKKYGIKYTGLLIETYNDNVRAPFIPEANTENFKYFGSMLLKSGGEIGLHGYNHMPLALDGFDYRGILDYKTWPDIEQMFAAMSELLRFGKFIFPQNDFITYVPPSNILENSGLDMLTERFPQIKIISGIYSGEYPEYEQEFDTGDKGIINLPRVVAGAEFTPYLKWKVLNEIGFHYINSHFLHSDDVLDDERGTQNGWKYLRQEYENFIEWIGKIAPGIRNMTAKQAGAAIERYDNLSVSTKYENNSVTVDLGGFYDEAWLMLRLNKGIAYKADGGSIQGITQNLYLIHATKERVTISMKENPR